MFSEAIVGLGNAAVGADAITIEELREQLAEAQKAAAHAEGALEQATRRSAGTAAWWRRIFGGRA